MKATRNRLFVLTLSLASLLGVGAVQAHAGILVPTPETWKFVNTYLCANPATSPTQIGTIVGLINLEVSGTYIDSVDSYSITVDIPPNPNINPPITGFDQTYTQNNSTIDIDTDPLIRVASNDPQVLTIDLDQLPFNGNTATILSSGSTFVVTDSNGNTLLSECVCGGQLIATPEPSTWLLLAPGLLLLGVAWRVRGRLV